MRLISGFGQLTFGVVLAAGFAACSTTTGTPVADTSSGASTSTTQPTSATPSITTSETASPSTPTGPPIGQAIMKIVGSAAGPVTVHYQINGGPEQVEANVTLPWEKPYPVYNELESKVSVEGTDASLTCTITMDGDKLVSFQSQPHPACNFAYWG